MKILKYDYLLYFDNVDMDKTLMCKYEMWLEKAEKIQGNR